MLQFRSVGISFVDDGLVLKIQARTSLSNTLVHYRVWGGSQRIGLLSRREGDRASEEFIRSDRGISALVMRYFAVSLTFVNRQFLNTTNPLKTTGTLYHIFHTL